MMDPAEIRKNILNQKAGIKHEPKMMEVKVDADVKDFDEALDEIAQRADALVNIAPSDKVELLQDIVEDLHALKHDKGGPDIEKPMESEENSHEPEEHPIGEGDKAGADNAAY